jgi:predicted GNAT family acetyltransferase
VDIKVIHDKKSERFVAEIEGYEAYASYSLHENIIKLYSTFTPYHLRGRGIAETIVEHVFNYARDNNLKVEPACSYVQTFLTRNEEFNDLIVD